ncbi:hypothetical protein [Nibricoccus sp. IMCC34717]|uniref:hypothetical protein n=1 Tax=Nibricoccus sp. IMCC34717 TaxID=3034021 RepID=UPI00385138F5
MNAKLFFRLVVFLVLCFVVLYIGMANTHLIEFQFPLVLEHKVRQPAAYLFFAFFAVGVVAGVALFSGGGGGKSAPSKKK